MLIGQPSIGRLLRWTDARLDRPPLCEPGGRGEMIVTPRVAREAGHPGYCSHAHDVLAQEDQVF